MPSLKIEHIVKEFPHSGGPKRVLNDVSFDVPEGSITCLIGPNGSGKTTLLRVISTLLSPNSGRVLVGDLDVHREPDRAKRLMGFASTEDHSFYGRLTVRMNLWFYAQLHGMGGAAFNSRVGQLASELELSDILRQPFRELSNGQKQRVLLARAILHDPSLVLLDEPHQNLDPHFAIKLRETMVREWGERQKKTILFSTHHLEDALKISDRWVILSQGRVRFQGSLNDERARRPGFTVENFFKELTVAL